MPYESTVSFTLDTICPWTYLALRRLLFALRQYRSSSISSKSDDNDSNAGGIPPCRFTLKFRPYQLYPEASKEGEDKYEWYRKSRYGDSEEKMKMYTTLMTAYGASVGVDFKFGGTVANTLDAHRLIWWVQEEVDAGEEVTVRLVESLYTQYFEQEKHPSSRETLLKAVEDAGLDTNKAKAVIDDEYECLQDVKMGIREQAGNGVDAVPYIVFEGRRRDFTLQGAKEVGEYLKTLEQVAKESL